MSKSMLEHCSELVNLPDECIPEHGLLMIGFVNGDGDQAYKYIAFEQAHIGQLFSLIRLVELDMWHKTYGEGAGE